MFSVQLAQAAGGDTGDNEKLGAEVAARRAQRHEEYLRALSQPLNGMPDQPYQRHPQAVIAAGRLDKSDAG